MGIGFEGLLHIDAPGASGAAALDVALAVVVPGGGLVELDFGLVWLTPLRDSRLAVKGGVVRLVAQLVHSDPPAAAAAAAARRLRPVLLGRLFDTDAELDKQRPQRSDTAGDNAQRRFDDGPNGRVNRVEQEVGRDANPLHVEDAYDLSNSGAAVCSSACGTLAVFGGPRLTGSPCQAEWQPQPWSAS